MRPPSAISGSSVCVRKNTPLKWTLTSPSNCASVVCADQGVVAVAGIVHEVIEASRAARSRAARGRSRSANAAKSATSPVSSCRATALRPIASNLGDDGLGVVGSALVGEDDVAAVAGDAERRYCGRARGWRR